MVVIWVLGFGRIRAAELVAMAAVNLLFVLMNQAALKQGTFVFNHPDFLGMPVYEFLTWGFYTQHTMRFLDRPPPQGRWIIVAGATGVFAVAFGTIADPNFLFLASACMLVIFFAMYHEPMDFTYAGYMAVVAELVEHVGEAAGQWHYPGQPLGRRPAEVTAAVGRDRTVYMASGPASGAATERTRTVIIIATVYAPTISPCSAGTAGEQGCPGPAWMMFGSPRRSPGSYRRRERSSRCRRWAG
jgi:hypothetical protein